MDRSSVAARALPWLAINQRTAPDEKVGKMRQDNGPCGCKIEVIDSRVGDGACVD